MIARGAKIADSIARAIVGDVAGSNLPVGSVLESESEMMKRYGVSRGSLREALRILEILGFIQIRSGPRGGPVLLDPNSRQFSTIASLYYQRINAKYLELLEMRLILEPQAAAWAAERRTEAHVEILRRYLGETRDSDLADDREFRAVGQGFHDLISEMSGNPILNLVIRSCYDLFAGRTTGFLYPKKERHCVADIHEQIAKAIINSNSKKARDLMRAHMDDYLSHAGKHFSGLMSEVVKW